MHQYTFAPIYGENIQPPIKLRVHKYNRFATFLLLRTFQYHICSFHTLRFSFGNLPICLFSKRCEKNDNKIESVAEWYLITIHLTKAYVRKYKNWRKPLNAIFPSTAAILKRSDAEIEDHIITCAQCKAFDVGQMSWQHLWKYL